MTASRHEDHLDFGGNFVQIINGKPAFTKTTRHGINPATLERMEEVPVATRDDLHEAVAAARAAFKQWSQTPYRDRKQAVLAWADTIESYSTEFRDLLIAEQGKPLPQAEIETASTVAWMRGMAGIELKDEVIEDSHARKIITRHTPLGVVAAIVPWNFPLMLTTAKVAPALLTGNVIIVKPSSCPVTLLSINTPNWPFTPYGCLKLVELAQLFFPPGVVQSLSGNDDLGPWITSHSGIDKISFTGSTATGKLVMRSASESLKRVTLELGGNDPAIVFPDVDIEETAKQVATFAFLNSGQVCLNLKRIYVHNSIYTQFRDAVVSAVKAFVIGNGSKEGVSHGPLQNSLQYSRVKTFFDDIETQGWKVAVGGKMDAKATKGYYVVPTVIDNPPEDSRIVVEEPFGPIVPLLSWETEDEVIERANNTTMGLGASVWSANTAQAEKVARRLEAGTVWINNHFDISPVAPFGGHKESGIGIEWGSNGLKEFCNVQTLFSYK
ncbi:unnamed protein product [Clonostachys byssicola]|uniref:aldehyde dehydrogenase (NAD(+)) n=1 Tax=Clonostachys byssicola TaxID=160290 RepID=A0A9N9UNU8_9HYPO|nr:unnamed protein product [Clonostachys byssicola]